MTIDYKIEHEKSMIVALPNSFLAVLAIAVSKV